MIQTYNPNTDDGGMKVIGKLQSKTLHQKWMNEWINEWIHIYIFTYIQQNGPDTESLGTSGTSLFNF